MFCMCSSQYRYSHAYISSTKRWRTSSGHQPLGTETFFCQGLICHQQRHVYPLSCSSRFGVLVGGWIIGSLLVPLVPTFIIPPSWSLELLTSLVAYIFLFLGSTFLKWTCLDLVTGTVGSFQGEITMTASSGFEFQKNFACTDPLEIGLLALLCLRLPFWIFFVSLGTHFFFYLLTRPWRCRDKCGISYYLAIHSVLCVVMNWCVRVQALKRVLCSVVSN